MVVIPDLVTRDELYERLHARLPNAPGRLTDYEREVIFRRAAIDAADEGTPAPFRLRPGLLLEVLSFYDELRRRDRTISAFERLLTGSLEASADTDRGAGSSLTTDPIPGQRLSPSSKSGVRRPVASTSTACARS